MKLLGLRICDHDSNISYYDGKNIFYLKTERFFQQKHKGENSLYSWKYLIKKVWDITPNEIDYFGIVLDPHTSQIPAPNRDSLYSNYKDFPGINNLININHHFAHSLSYFPLNITPDISIVMDGLGDPDVAWSIFKDNDLIDQGSWQNHGSLGVEMHSLMDVIDRYRSYPPLFNTNHLDVPGKIMGLQSYGKVDFTFLKILENYDLFTIKDLFYYGLWVSYKKDEIIADLTRLDWLATVHERVGDLLIEFFSKYCSPNDTIFYSGGVAQNVIWNTKLKNYFPNLHILPQCADDGISLGIIEFLRRQHNLPKVPLKNYPYCQSDDIPSSTPTIETIKKTAQLLSQGKIIGWYQGKGEIGPRALGNRSILFNPLISNGKEIVNKVKNRENFRPFGATVLEEKASEYFEIEYPNPYMLYVNKVKDSRLKSVTHIDGTCRTQTINPTQNPLYYTLIKEFEKITGVPILLNTSLNINGKPIAAYQDNAHELLHTSELDYLVIGDKIFSK